MKINRKCKFCGKEKDPSDHLLYCSSECKFNSLYIKTLAKYFNINKDHIGTKLIINDINNIREYVYNLYWIEEKTSGEICKIIGYPNVSNFSFEILEKLHIPIRNKSQAVKLNYLKGQNITQMKNVMYKHGWHTTWDNHEVYLRSSYEFEYAEQLDTDKIHYEVENFRIKYFSTQKNDYRCAIPDFYIPSINTIVEIKSQFTLDIQNMKDRFKAYQELGYNTELILDHKKVNLYDL